MTLFIDTSAFYAILDANDKNHKAAKGVWIENLDKMTEFLSHNYIIVETIALLQNRLGMEATSTFNNDILPLINIKWVDENVHQTGISSFLTAARTKLSLVDCISFIIMREYEINTTFTFDPHFTEQGFNTVPP